MIRAVSYSEILNDPAAPLLLEEYAAECSISELGTPRPQPELYAALERSGGMQAFGVYDEAKLVGFAVVLIYILPHYGLKIATSESIFVTPRYRGSRVGLVLFIEDYARNHGCIGYLHSARVGTQFDQVLSSRATHTSNVYLVTL